MNISKPRDKSPRTGAFARAAKRLLRLAGSVRVSRPASHPENEPFKLALEAMPEGLAYLDAAGRYVLWNARYAELAFDKKIHPGTSFEAVLRTGLGRGLYAQALGREEAWLQERLARRQSEHSVHEQPLGDGRWLRIEERRTADGGTVATLVDITELKLKEASFRLMFESNPAPMWVHQAATWRLLSVNDAAVRLFGYSRETLLVMTAWDLMPKEQAAELRDMLTGRAESASYHGERSWRFLTAGGAEVHLLPYMQELTHQGTPARLVAMWDVTARLKAEDELRRTRAFLDTLIDSIPAMLLVKDAREHRYVLWNRMAEELTGVPRERVLGKTVHEIFPPDEAEVTADRDRRVFESGAGVLVHEGPLTTADGRTLDIVSRRIAVSGPDGRPDFMAAIIEDVTERTRAAQALAVAWEEADAANRAKSEFLANMSHEIRTPLNGVLALASVLARSQLDPSQREIVEIIESSAVTLERLLSDILDLARVESGRLEITCERFDLAAALKSVAALCKLRAEEKKVGFILDVDEAAQRWVIGDPVRVKQVLTNLLNNAVKFTESGEVSLTASVVGGPTRPMFKFVVRDTGIGFSAEAKAGLFSRFQQADGSITRRFGGSGLGLAICHQLTTLMGGTLAADSMVGQGSVFTVELPLQPTQAADGGPDDAEAGLKRPPGETSEKRRRVLLAEDHAVNRRVIELILQGLALDLTCVGNGREAVDSYRERGFDLVLMDMQMPVLDGLAAVKQIRDLERRRGHARTPILMLSANAMPEHLESARVAGADGYVTKPVQPAALLAEIAKVLGVSLSSDSAAA